MLAPAKNPPRRKALLAFGLLAIAWLSPGCSSSEMEAVPVRERAGPGPPADTAVTKPTKAGKGKTVEGDIKAHLRGE
jgi:hypothetical protein